MPAQERFKTDYPGVYFIMGKAIATGKPEKIYYIDYRKDGKRIQEKAGRQYQDDMTPAKANRIRTNKIEGRELPNVEKRAAVEAAKRAEDSRYTIAKLWDAYCESNPDNKALGHDKRKFDLHLRDGIGKKDPAELLPLDVDRVRLSLQKSGKRTQAARVLEILRRTINYGVKRGLIAPLPFKIEVPRLNNQTTEDLNQDQLKALLKALDADEDQAAANVMRIALYTGMRRSEIFGLKWADLDFERKFIAIRDPKGGRDQTIPMNEMAEKIFVGITALDGNPYVFPGRKKGTHLTECRKAFDRIRKAAMLPVGFRPLHGLRHVYASMLASSGRVDLYTLQRLLTHKSPTMTARYAHLRDDALRQASNLAGELVTAAVTEKKDQTG
ncbi:tyrosine-type recombinase/integrase [Desulfatitalea tepidiphila]|uniref:tyrosine-type recombinase/integrase n=1 Tax=Desulfatitalea tepidiphila TaxID=1185843 RepID=UPI0006B5F1E4|nr:site-specific integrase [Desulfatitalea tepidiphila]